MDNNGQYNNQQYNNQQYNNGNMPMKEPFSFKIAGFTFGMKHIIILGVIIVLFAFSSWYSNYKEEKEHERLLAEEEAANSHTSTEATTTETDYDAKMQANLEEKYGIAPEGFEWDVLGNLIATTGSDDMTAEDVAYTYLRAISILDFSTAQKYASNSSVIETYTDYYGNVTRNIADYYSEFLRKQYKFALTTLEVEEISDVAVFADGSEYVSVKVKMIDLTDKDFWRKDMDLIYQNLYKFNKDESDSTKAEQYLYDYIYKAYENGDVPMRDVDVEIVLKKPNGAGWLIDNDGELSHMLSYEWGTDVANYIQSEYNVWSIEHTIELQNN